jgi:hypothetical protein
MSFWSLTLKSLRSVLQPLKPQFFHRLEAISQDSEHQAERHAIEDALASLSFLKSAKSGIA